ncbi:DNA 5'-adenosine monophosphate hydrolase [Aspergillus stella-maris]|uniref:DNA 5'-adenosine monophosphate hydrolase n=1 Tax=Aspergillus stella-maris TaxID=1810926 RepID=UPI003CCCB0E4
MESDADSSLAAGAEKQPVKRNAFTELLSSKTKQPKPSSSSGLAKGTAKQAPKKSYNPRDGLGAYIEKPETYPPNVVVYHNADFVVIHDLFPKATLHLLLLPRDASKTFVHPVQAFNDAEFLSNVKEEVKKVRALAAGELRRIHGKHSALDRERQDALGAEPPPDVLPSGRDWESQLMCGIHAHPSMNHLHVHIISKDRYSDRLKHRKHYNSFSTPFFIDIDDFPLAEGDPRRDPDRQGYLKRDFICWRCGRNYGNQFTALKRHLEEEFDQWKLL